MAVVEVFNTYDFETILKKEFVFEGIVCKVRKFLDPVQRIQLNESRLQQRVYFSLPRSIFTEPDAKRIFSVFGGIETVFFYPVRSPREEVSENRIFSGFVLFKSIDSAKKCLQADGVLKHSGIVLRLFGHEMYQS
jgi:hypothetical protein